MNIILLSGGSGTRLWPLSNETMSKQFLRLLRDDNGKKESMVQRVFRQIKETGIKANIVIATNNKQLDSIRNQLGNVDVVLEPERRNTYPAILLASAYLKYEKKVDKEDSVLVLPVDPYTENTYFETLIKMDKAIQDNKADMVLMGINPTYPSEKYGYIVCKDSNDETKEVDRFQEKPDLEKAKQLLEEGACWNAGVFGFKLKYIEEILNKEIKNESFEDVYNHYSDITKNSFDYEVVEKAKSIAMVPFAGDWKDLGTWNTLSEEIFFPERNIITDDSAESIGVINITEGPATLLKIKDMTIVIGTEGVLVTGRDKTSQFRIEERNTNKVPIQHDRFMDEYTVIDERIFDDGTKSLIEYAVIEKGKTVFCQSDNGYDEIWTVIKGEAEIIDCDKKRIIKSMDTVRIEKVYQQKVTSLSRLELVVVIIGRNQQKIIC